jgi:hypothetical protein
VNTEQIRGYVQARWQGAEYRGGRVYATHPMRSAEWILSGNGSNQTLSEHDAWQAAYACTLKNEQVIKDAQAEISEISYWIEYYEGMREEHPICDRILSRAKQHLADSQCGMKEPS